MTSVRRLVAILVLVAVPLVGTQALANEGKGHGKGGSKKSSEPEPEASPTPDPSPTPDAPDKPGKPKNDPDPGPGPGPDPEPPGQGELTVTTEAAKLLVQVGDEIPYTVTVSNPGDAALEEVFVIDVVPDEVDVVGVVDNPAVEAVQLGQHNGKEDIVWNVGTLAPGQELVLSWMGRASKAGDLEAVNNVTAEAAQASTQASGTNYVGALEDRDVRNPAFKPIRKKVVTVSRPTVTKVLAAPPDVEGAVLPFTGSEPVPWFILGLALIGAGAAALVLARVGPGRRHVVLLAVIALVLTACVSDQKSPVDKSAAPAEQPAEVDTDTDTDEDDDVLGTRFKKDPKNDDAEADDPALDTPEPQVIEVLGEPVEHVEIVEITLEDLKTEDVGSRPGDNHLTYEWDADSDSIVTAASSRVLVQGQKLELLTSVSDADGDIDIVVTLTNLSKLERARVHGRLIHTVYGAGGVITTFESPVIDTVLDPGGSTNATFTYMLPTGSYSAEGSFQAA